MKKLTILLLGAILIVLTTGYVKTTFADHLGDDDNSIFSAMEAANLAVSDKDSKYQMHLQTTVRNEEGHLIYVTESTSSAYIPHEITDHVFDTLMGKKTIIVIDNIEYEKTKFTFTPTLQQRYMSVYPIWSDEGKFNVEFDRESVAKMYELDKLHTVWKIHYCKDFGEGHDFQCVPIFQSLVPASILKPSETATLQWTILRNNDITAVP